MVARNEAHRCACCFWSRSPHKTQHSRFLIAAAAAAAAAVPQACFLSLAVLHALCMRDACCDKQIALRLVGAMVALVLPLVLPSGNCVAELCAVAAVCVAQMLADMLLLPPLVKH